MPIVPHKLIFDLILDQIHNFFFNSRLQYCMKINNCAIAEQPCVSEKLNVACEYRFHLSE